MTNTQFGSSGAIESWPNDDLVLRKGTWVHLQETFPRVAPIFDASDLHALFLEHDKPANVLKKRARRWGMVAIALGLGSICLAAVTPVALVLFPELEQELVRKMGVMVCLSLIHI